MSEVLDMLGRVALKKFNIEITDAKVDHKGNLIFNAFYNKHKRLVILTKEQRVNVLEVLQVWVEKCQFLDNLKKRN